MKTLSNALLICAAALILNGCSIAQGMKYAVQCDADKAIASIVDNEKDPGLMSNLAYLEHEAILREAGRIEEADKIRQKREQIFKLSAQEKAEAEKAITETVDNIRSERLKQTGSRSCGQGVD